MKTPNRSFKPVVEAVVIIALLVVLLWING